MTKLCSEVLERQFKNLDRNNEGIEIYFQFRIMGLGRGDLQTWWSFANAAFVFLYGKACEFGEMLLE